MSAPRVSVITATYNRANVLRFTIESLRAQSVSDWELLAIGDACTDETEDVVRSFADERIRFVNLPVNSGEQATPNNEGIRLARGEFLAFLNHDDLWTPDHLATCLAAIGERKLIATRTVVIDPAGSPVLVNAWISAPASSWFLRRELIDEVGPWRRGRELLVPPSQDFLFRARKRGYPLQFVDATTVLAVQSGGRKNSYAARESRENATWAARLNGDPRLLDKLAGEWRPARRPLRQALTGLVRRLTELLGFHPNSLYYAMKFRRRGGFLDSLRKTRGLPPLPRAGDAA